MVLAMFCVPFVAFAMESIVRDMRALSTDAAGHMDPAMPEDAYQMEAHKASIKHTHLITGKTQKPDWYTSGYAVSGQRGMWLINLRYMDKRKCWDQAPDAWLVCLLQTLPARPFLVMDTVVGEGSVT